MALLGGGFDIESRHLVGVVAWLMVLILLVSPYRRQVRFSRQFAVVAGLILAFAILNAASAFWSDAASRSLTEAERTVAYLGFFAVTFLVCQTERQRQCFVEGLAIVLGLLILYALGDRLLPGSAPISAAEQGARLRFPLGYWNAVGVVFGITIVVSSWLGRRGSANWLRVAGVALIPAAIVGLYLTYSRGGFVAAGVSLICLFFLSRDRLWLVTVVVTGIACSIPVLKLVQSSPAIAQNLGGESAPGEGRIVALALILAMAANVGIVWCVGRLLRSRPAQSRRLLEISRKRRVVWGCAAVITLSFIVAAVAFGPKAWDSYTQGPLDFPDDPQQHLTQLSSNGRYDQNKIAIRAFEDHPLLGIGAGTFRFEWARERPNDLVVQDAHSIYLESFAELGALGGILVIALMISLIWCGVTAFRQSSSGNRERIAVILAVMAALIVTFGIDWFWELGATGALLMMTGAVAAAEASAFRRGGRRPAPAASRAVIGAFAAWTAIVLLVIPVLAERAIEQSAAASLAGRVDESIDKARLAQKLDPFSPAPHLQIGVIAESRGDYDEAIDEYTRAIELEPDNWRSWYMRMMARTEAGSDPNLVDEDYDKAFSLNPRAPELAPENLLELPPQP